MVKEIKNSTCECPKTVDDLLEAMQNSEEKYKHLQIIQRRSTSNCNLQMGQKYLVVNPNGFGVYQLLDINYFNGVIQLKLKENNTNKIVHTSLNINDKHPQIFLICWKDIKQMVYEGNESNEQDDILLEFEF